MPRILVVEDEPDIALGLAEDLGRHGYEVETVTDGERAVHRGKERGWDLILLDIMLPRKDRFLPRDRGKTRNAECRITRSQPAWRDSGPMMTGTRRLHHSA